MIIRTQFLKFVLEIQNIFQNPTTQRQYRFDSHSVVSHYIEDRTRRIHTIRGRTHCLSKKKDFKFRVHSIIM